MLHIEVFSIHIVSVFSHLQVAHTKIEGQPMKRLKSSPCKDHTLEKVYFPETS